MKIHVHTFAPAKPGCFCAGSVAPHHRRHQQPPSQPDKAGRRWARRSAAHLGESCFCACQRYQSSGQYVSIRSRISASRMARNSRLFTSAMLTNCFSVVLIDTSVLTAPFIDQIKARQRLFVDQMRPADTIRPIYFHGEIKPLSAEGINDPKVFDAAIDRIEPGPSMGTRLYDVVHGSTHRPAATQGEC